MVSEPIQPEVLELICKHVSSIELIEVLRLIHAEPEREWSVDLVNVAIRSSAASIEGRLRELEQLGFVVRISDSPHAMYRYSPKDDETRSLADATLKTYQLRRTEVTELIYTKPMKEILSFSDAFRMRRTKKDG